ncbi:MAG: hypothetical protein KIT35_12640 [Piscinibacter sp.]|uniref:hypothetical protein n=1 Tax=Piscinibacter sp. TaxID=1903157 RepID=UPI0025828F65|nr:hypothetical protein [Piscinibacter sp.]MCW5664676.1 hypothetical protein [Piscinibacter sp.]
MFATPTPRAPSAAPAAVLVSLVFALAYAASNHLTALRADVGTGVFDWEHTIPFVPWTIVPYLSIVPLFVASFFVGRSHGALRRHTRRLLLLLALALAGWALCPLRFAFERPPVDGWAGALFELLALLDRPYNRAPSLHIGVLVLLWLHLGPRLAGWWRAALGGWLLLIGVSVLTTWQHHVIDIPAGAAAALLCVLLTRRPTSPCPAPAGTPLPSRRASWRRRTCPARP